jgi:membrane protein DedA with SNARE-associated domain
MTLKSFFLLIFISSVSICILFFFFTGETDLFLLNIGINYKINYTFITLVSLITSIFSYIGLTVSFYLSRKKEKTRLKRVEAERKSLTKIQQELKALKQGFSI